MADETPKRKTNPYIAVFFALAIATTISGLAILALVKQQELDELQRQHDATKKREAIYKEQTIWARNQFNVYADSLEDFSSRDDIDKPGMIRQLREQSTKLQKQIDQAEAIK